MREHLYPPALDRILEEARANEISAIAIGHFLGVAVAHGSSVEDILRDGNSIVENCQRQAGQDNTNLLLASSYIGQALLEHPGKDGGTSKAAQAYAHLQSANEHLDEEQFAIALVRNGLTLLQDSGLGLERHLNLLNNANQGITGALQTVDILTRTWQRIGQATARYIERRKTETITVCGAIQSAENGKEHLMPSPSDTPLIVTPAALADTIAEQVQRLAGVPERLTQVIIQMAGLSMPHSQADEVLRSVNHAVLPAQLPGLHNEMGGALEKLVLPMDAQALQELIGTLNKAVTELRTAQASTDQAHGQRAEALAGLNTTTQALESYLERGNS